MRNGRWSVTQPIPSLGIKEVDAFYDFWFSFKSWREFLHEDEYDLEQAENMDGKTRSYCVKNEGVLLI